MNEREPERIEAIRQIRALVIDDVKRQIDIWEKEVWTREEAAYHIAYHWIGEIGAAVSEACREALEQTAAQR